MLNSLVFQSLFQLLLLLLWLPLIWLYLKPFVSIFLLKMVLVLSNRLWVHLLLRLFIISLPKLLESARGLNDSGEYITDESGYPLCSFIVGSPRFLVFNICCWYGFLVAS